jgi:copper transport protein
MGTTGHENGQRLPKFWELRKSGLGPFSTWRRSDGVYMRAALDRHDAPSSDQNAALSRWLKIGACVLATIVSAFAWPVYLVSAHANLIHSDPAAGAVVAKAPAEIVMEFSEDLDASFTAVQLMDQAGHVVAEGPGIINKSAPRILRLAVPELPDGVYSALWKARSATDGHVTLGTLSFATGKATQSAADLLATIPAVDAVDPGSFLPTTRETVARWLNYIAVAFVAGALAFAMLVWRPAYKLATAQGLDGADGRISTSLKTVAALGVVALVVFGIADAVVRVGLAVGQPLSASSAAYASFLAGRTGQIFLARCALALLIAFLLRRAPRAGAGSSSIWLLGWAASAGVLATFSLQSHSAGRAGHVLFDWLHINAMSIWLGGLIPLAIILVEARRYKDAPINWIIRRFSVVALLCVTILAATGLYNAEALVGTVNGLTQTTFGRALIIKLSLFAILFALGAINLMLISPRIEHAHDSWAAWLGRTVRTEMITGVLLLLMVSVLTASVPTVDVRATQQASGVQIAQVSGVSMKLWVVPAAPGNNAFAADIVDGRRNAGIAPATVILRIARIAGNGVADASSITQIETTSSDGKRYTAAGSYFPSAGRWLVQVILRKGGFNDVHASFTVPVGQQ